MSLMKKEREITEPVKLCDENGNLNAASVGWSRRPLITSNLKGQFLRKKKWHYWCVNGQDALFSATISHLDYAAVCFVYYLDYKTKDFYEKTVLMPLGLKTNMPEEVLASAENLHKDMGIFFIWDGSDTHLKVSIPDFGGKPLKADIKVYYPENHDTLNVVIPWSSTKFQYTAKQQCLPAEGTFSVGDKMYTFDKATDSAILDYGRGVWPRTSTWNWGTASGRNNGDMVGLNFGGQWTDGTGVTENGFLVNGRLVKVSDNVAFEFNRNDMMEPWQINTRESSQVRLTFEPFYHRQSATSAILVKSEMHQMFGHYYGELTDEDGSTITINALPGSIEDHFAHW
ncbi:DUF2804 domain-containing protein [Evansella sp. LMS18]|jgi:hypothetical protein|uniref:DUF2804 domain-containing protein n=1 Tax=Evansella sp. LMS18 TaxID=2924033 RepID=UPI0020D02BA7|nr:DUF2804 domain-containing protein [Evansella sp. LMS18]UTR08879.1 DUF2804 domain-containing protein [Evansella sp. LMS18]